MNLTYLLAPLQFVSSFVSNSSVLPLPSAQQQALSDMAPPAASVLDVLIIGGGPSGLSVATGLARQLYSAVVFDSGLYRNELAKHMHNVVTWDHQKPADFRKKARDDLLKRYNTIQFQDAKITNVAKTAKGVFEAKDDKGQTWLGRKLVLATGVQDLYPDIDGYGDCWASGMYAPLSSYYRDYHCFHFSPITRITSCACLFC